MKKIIKSEFCTGTIRSFFYKSRLLLPSLSCTIQKFYVLTFDVPSSSSINYDKYSKAQITKRNSITAYSDYCLRFLELFGFISRLSVNALNSLFLFNTGNGTFRFVSRLSFSNIKTFVIPACVFKTMQTTHKVEEKLHRFFLFQTEIHHVQVDNYDILFCALTTLPNSDSLL